MRLDECRTYLATWEAAAAAIEYDRPMPEDCASEMNDAVWSGEYAYIYTDEESAKLKAVGFE